MEWWRGSTWCKRLWYAIQVGVIGYGVRMNSSKWIGVKPPDRAKLWIWEKEISSERFALSGDLPRFRLSHFSATHIPLTWQITRRWAGVIPQRASCDSLFSLLIRWSNYNESTNRWSTRFEWTYQQLIRLSFTCSAKLQLASWKMTRITRFGAIRLNFSRGPTSQSLMSLTE